MTDEDFECDHGPRAGIVTSGGLEGAHAAVDTCGHPTCVLRAKEWASSVTGEPAEYRPDPPTWEPLIDVPLDHG